MVTTKYGRVRGVSQDGIRLFFGIPYAKADRFCLPQEPDCWNGVLECKFPRARCVEEVPEPGAPYTIEFYDDSAYNCEMSEHCQYLNIRTPQTDPAAKLPVAVYIHGGAFHNGWGTEKEFDSNTIPRQGVVLVTINYRLNIFGNFTCRQLVKELGTPGNFGMRDQIAALRWVKENIAAFGGDPDNITIFGQSAGAAGVRMLVSSQAAKGLFQRAIMQSGEGFHSNFSMLRSLDTALAQGEEILSILGMTLDDLRAMGDRELFSQLKKLPFDLSRSNLPFIDGDLLTDDLDALADRGEIHDIDYMLGSNENDLTCTYRQMAEGRPSRLYMGNNSWNLNLEKLGRRPGYSYFFRRRMPGDDWGAFHSAELWYVLGSLDKCWRPLTEEDYALSRRMVKDWTNFFKTGDPGYPPHTAADPHVEVYDCGETGGYLADGEKNIWVPKD